MACSHCDQKYLTQKERGYALFSKMLNSSIKLVVWCIIWGLIIMAVSNYKALDYKLNLDLLLLTVY